MKCGKVANPDGLPTTKLHGNAKNLADAPPFGRLTAIRPVGRQGSFVVWLCSCSCGTMTTASTRNLINGHVTSCGCLRHEQLVSRNERGPNEYVVTADGSLVVTLTDRNNRSCGYTLIDDTDADLLHVRWSLARSGYAATNAGGTKSLLHRAVLCTHGHALETSDFVDHIDGNKLNNRLANLRVATCRENTWHRTKILAASGYKGVYLDKRRGTWCAEIHRDYVKRRLGCFDSPEEAALAYNKAAIELFGEYAHLDVIGSPKVPA